jgi:hypothetical protein
VILREPESSKTNKGRFFRSIDKLQVARRLFFAVQSLYSGNTFVTSTVTKSFITDMRKVFVYDEEKIYPPFLGRS